MPKNPPVGHWNSAAGYEDYRSKYDAAMRDLPAATTVRDLRTDYGVVRVYRYAGAKSGLDPLVLLPGTSSGTPVWADNLKSLLAITDVYAIDLLGEAFGFQDVQAVRRSFSSMNQVATTLTTAVAARYPQASHGDPCVTEMSAVTIIGVMPEA